MPAVVYQEPYPASTRGNRWGIRGPKYGPAGHRGQDWAPGDEPALAFADGVVVISQWSDFLGHVVELRHADGMFTGYAHLAAAGFRIGTEVDRHHTVGAHVGQTGSAALGRHLHATVSDHEGGIFSGRTLDPLKWIREHGAPAAKPATGRTVVVKDGDTLSKIAAAHGTTWQKLAAKNGLRAPYVIHAGQKLAV